VKCTPLATTTKEVLFAVLLCAIASALLLLPTVTDITDA
jgi:hypothetical protein